MPLHRPNDPFPESVTDWDRGQRWLQVLAVTLLLVGAVFLGIAAFSAATCSSSHPCFGGGEGTDPLIGVLFLVAAVLLFVAWARTRREGIPT